MSYPRIGVGLVHGIDETYRIDWVADDLAYLVDSEYEEIVLEFASTREEGFISDLDVIDQASDIVSGWDAENL